MRVGPILHEVALSRTTLEVLLHDMQRKIGTSMKTPIQHGLGETGLILVEMVMPSTNVGYLSQGHVLIVTMLILRGGPVLQTEEGANIEIHESLYGIERSVVSSPLYS